MSSRNIYSWSLPSSRVLLRGPRVLRFLEYIHASLQTKFKEKALAHTLHPTQPRTQAQGGNALARAHAGVLGEDATTDLYRTGLRLVNKNCPNQDGGKLGPCSHGSNH